ncbi:MAG: hypothetical protein LKE48_03360 [Solobacterium sp.]|jgi:hypothetical protein|nr:hypothetical protein [Solobacterium sp.]MCH4281543.1 hypothetical protein [Solobacterium sp.]
MNSKSKIVSIVLSMLMISTIVGCTKSDRVNYNIKNDADNFKVKRKLIALNTRTNEALFTVEGYLSINVDNDGDLNVTIQTGDDDYKLFYAHLSDDVTYTSVQTDGSDVTPYAYQISFFPAKEAIEHGLLDATSTD